MVHAVGGISHTVEAGEAVAIVGESGCGKSVGAMSILRLIPEPPGRIVRGEVLFEGRDLLKLSNAEIRDVRDTLGAGDQGMMVGYACIETDDLMPLPIAMSHALTRRLAMVRKDGVLPYLRPDGKSQVTVEYAYGLPRRFHTVVISTQHDPDVTSEQLQRDIQTYVIEPVLPADMVDSSTKVYINPSGKFVLGGPNADTGLTGRKILVDTYGGSARHGGGAFSGKDPTKVDRSGAYAARYVAKNIVAAGLAERAEVQISYAIGVAEPISVSIETFQTGKVAHEVIQDLVSQHFDLRPGAIINDMQLRRPIYKQTAAYGHFGRPDLDLPWERIDKAEVLRIDAGHRLRD